jgi:hypothetical protein
MLSFDFPSEFFYHLRGLVAGPIVCIIEDSYLVSAVNPYTVAELLDSNLAF